MIKLKQILLENKKYSNYWYFYEPASTETEKQLGLDSKRKNVYLQYLKNNLPTNWTYETPPFSKNGIIFYSK